MNPERDFLVTRRRANLVDLITPRRVGVDGYRFQASKTFDGTFTTIFTATVSGYLDSNVDRRLLTTLNNKNHVRCVFDPQTFNAAAPSLVDVDQFWLRFVPVTGGVPGTTGARALVLPEDESVQSRITITGDAPNGAAVANSLRLDFPRRMKDMRIKNNEASGGDTLYVAFAPGSAEVIIPPQEHRDFLAGAQATLMVRGGGGAVNFTAGLTHFLPF